MDFIKLVSAERFQSYKTSANDSEETLIKRYLLNAELCSAFYVPLHIVEIGLRNSLFDAIAKQYGENWLTNNILHEREQNLVNNAIYDLKRRHESYQKGKIIAELSFGFWVSLLYLKYDSPSFKDKNKAIFWPHCIRDSFPYMKNRFRTRKQAEIKIEAVRKFRNRIFHHEPIWKMNLIEKHKDILEVISWFYKDYENIVSIDRVKEVLSRNKF